MNNICDIDIVQIPHPALDIVAGSSHSLAICADCVYAWGKAEHSNLGFKWDEKDFISEPVKLEIAVSQAAAGESHSYAWKKNQVFCWGCNQNWELGFENSSQFELTKSQIFTEAFEAGMELKQIVCGNSHSIAEEDKGNADDEPESQQQQCSFIFAWGDSKSYQLGLETNSIVPQPVLLDFKVKVSKICSKSDYNILVTDEGLCYSWGSNLFGRIGLSNSVKNHKYPTNIPSLKNITEIALGKYHCIAIDKDHTAYSWGHGMHGQLGIDKIVSEISPTEILFPYPIFQASCGEHHTIIVCSAGVFSCGSNSNNSLGHSQTDIKKRCKKLEKVNINLACDQIIKISSGNRHNLALAKDGIIYSWGCNKLGQLGRKQRSSLEANRKASENRVGSSPISEVSSFDRHQSRINENSAYKLASEMVPIQTQLLEWKKRYQRFKKEQQQKQKQFMLEFQSILKSSEK